MSPHYRNALIALSRIPIRELPRYIAEVASVYEREYAIVQRDLLDYVMAEC